MRVIVVLALKQRDCLAFQDPARVFINNIIVRFHSGLELDGDEVKTIICKYPEPRAPPPVAPVPLIPPEPPAAVVPPPASLGEVEILMIICAILFLAFLLLGMGCSYYCLKRRNIKIIRRKSPSTIPGSEITKLSESLFENLKIPRAHAASTSGSEANLVSTEETIPSDYPSESPSSLHSEVEDVDTRSLKRESSVSSQSLRELSSVYSDAHLAIDQELVTAPILHRLPRPEFDVAVRIKKAPKVPDSKLEQMKAQERTLTTILEREESRRSDDIEHGLAEMIEVPDSLLPPAKKRAGPPPVQAKIRKRQLETAYEERDETASEVSDAPPQRTKSLSSLNTEITDTRSVTEMMTEQGRVYEPPPPPSEYTSEARSVSDMEMEGAVVPRPPQISKHIVDDRYLTTITETKTYEDLMRHSRETKELHTKPKPLPPNWDVIIRNYPAPQLTNSERESSLSDWEKFSEPESMATTRYSEPGSERPRSMFDTTEETTYQTTLEVQREDQRISNWEVLVRVLSPPPMEVTADLGEPVLTDDDREKWRRIITTESTLRTLLTEATVREDFERIRQDQRYEKLFEPRKWDVIIRVLNPPEEDRKSDGSDSSYHPRYRKKSDVSSRRSVPSEYDSETAPSRGPGSTRSRRTSRSSLGLENDLRSMTEETVTDFARSDMDSYSEASGHTSRHPRSMAERSTSEFTDKVQVLDEDQLSSWSRPKRSSRAESQRSLERGMSEFAEDWAAHPESDKESFYSSSSLGRDGALVPASGPPPPPIPSHEGEHHAQAAGYRAVQMRSAVASRDDGSTQLHAASYRGVSQWMEEYHSHR
ncbi:unnamed protein product [Darwinula stevensoni]|uniref:Uncharacterized protein n=1 Tax=Darwinula stevensoni TaxID=69355 RepID=A0A7R9AHD4_9CRUS|nr:unnamed protein product [Darwinula stevensoni]CAG0905406.1 unnamed protein product [Darwinula stevensoni]